MRLMKKEVARPTPTVRLAIATDSAIINVAKLKSLAPTLVASQLEYLGRPDMRMFIDNYLKKYNDKGDMIYSAGNIHIFRSQIDELLIDQNLDNNHIYAFAILLAEKNKLHPGLYQPLIFVSSLHWDSNFLLMPVAEKLHWTLLVANLKSLAWLFFDSLPNLTHRVVLPDVINHLCEKTLDCFEGDIQNCSLNVVNGIPTQTNGFNYGMFIYKYMEAAMLPHAIKWEELIHWQDEMPKFRAEFVYAILCVMIK
ncbi:hypothetical protein IEQ34_001248 [Dendrobium chrysotoxum]|uniref:Ubiquitin-like protease family profile domain-containing protein n=1 Tax=Dendrobium chrysotoxum TaxID=161865 RepID=A0AAV7HNL0_DENCH|nr:hypothetical protein IEQ34_001248 [Dendrobium chrysotoxum]